MLKIRFAVLVISSLVFICGCTAPEPGLIGEVHDQNGKALADAKVKIVGTDFSVQTDILGKYNLGYEPGSLKVMFEKEGYNGKVVPLTLNKRTQYKMQLITMKIKNNPLAVEEVVLKIVEAQIFYKMESENSSYAASKELLKQKGDSGKPFLKKAFQVDQVGGSLVEFIPGTADEKGVIKDFQVRTKPISYPESGKISFYADQDDIHKGDNGGKWGSADLPAIGSEVEPVDPPME